MKHLLSTAFVLTGWSSAFADEVVNVYSARHYDTDMAMYERFTEETGIKVNLIEGSSDALIERFKSEGQFSPADMLITVDAGRLWRCLLYTSPSPRDLSTSRMPSSA